MTAVMWPFNMRPSEVMFHPDQPSRSGGRSITGREQVVTAAGAGAWRATLRFPVFPDPAPNRLLSWRALLAIVEGRTNRVLIGPYDDGNTPAALSGVDYSALVPFDDDATFDDGTYFSQFATPVAAAVAAARGAVAVTADMIGGHTPQPGQYFGTYNRLYLIKRATVIDDALALSADGLVLSNDDLTATRAAVGTPLFEGNSALSNTYAKGKVCFAATFGTVTGVYAGVGVALVAQDLSGPVLGGAEATSVAYWSDGTVGIAGSFAINTLSTFASGDVVLVAVDRVNSKIWFKKNSGNWNNNVTHDPATNVGGITLASLDPGKLYAAVSLRDVGAVSLDFAPTGLPAGFATWQSGDRYELRFWPPLRAAINAGAALNFDTPVCEMRMASDASGELSLRNLYHGDPSIDLVEVF